MGGAPQKIKKAVSKVGKGAVKGVGEIFEEVVEKPGKQIIQETKETITGRTGS